MRAVVRQSGRGEAARAAGAEVKVADVGDPVALARAFDGVEGAYIMLPPRTDAEDLVAAAQPAIAAIAQAVAEARVPHVVLLSAVGAQHATLVGPVRVNHDAERALRAVTPALTALRPPYFMENWQTALEGVAAGELYSMIALDQSIPMIATEDIGRFAATALLEGARGHRVIELEGPREYSPRNVARALAELTGRRVEPVFVPNGAIVATLQSFGMSARTAEVFASCTKAIAVGRLTHEGKGPAPLRGKVEIEEVLRGLLQANRRGASAA